MDLKCLEVVCEIADNNFAVNDKAISQDPRVILNLMALERATIPHLDYFRLVQADLKPFMRKIVTTWMLEVSFKNGSDLLTCVSSLSLSTQTNSQSHTLSLSFVKRFAMNNDAKNKFSHWLSTMWIVSFVSVRFRAKRYNCSELAVFCSRQRYDNVTHWQLTSFAPTQTTVWLPNKLGWVLVL